MTRKSYSVQQLIQGIDAEGKWEAIREMRNQLLYGRSNAERKRFLRNLDVS